MVDETAASSFDARHGLHALKGLTLMFFYALPDEQGLNPNWEALGYPGPNSPAPSAAEAPKTIRVEDVSGPSATLTADVCVVGSGAGGAVIAAGCAQAGLSVLVLEMGAYRNEADFKQLEIPGMFELYLGGGLLTSENGSIAVLAGSTLGGGTVVNYMNCIRTPQHIRDEWAQHGLDGLDAAEYERDHIDAVSERLGTNTEMTRQNGTHQLLMQGLDALGHGASADRAQRGSHRRPGVLRLLLDGVSARLQALHDEDLAAGRVRRRRAMRRAVPGRPRADRGRPRRGSGRDHHARRRQRDRAHGGGADRRDRVRWRGVTRAAAALGDRRAGGRQVPAPASRLFGQRHLRRPGRGLARSAPVARVGLVRRARGRLRIPDRGHGDISRPLGRFTCPGRAEPTTSARWRSCASWRRSSASSATMGAARSSSTISAARWCAGGSTIRSTTASRCAQTWSLRGCTTRPARPRSSRCTPTGSDGGAARTSTSFLGAIEQAPYGPLDIVCFTAHQMGACRMGKDPATSVADGHGELHDTKGVWIGDASAFPTAPGVNPMISIMSLAHRTADHVVASRRG